MKRRSLVFLLTCAAVHAASAQQMPGMDMGGMQMDHGSMPGMQHGAPPQPGPQEKGTAAGKQGKTVQQGAPGNTPAGRAEQSLQSSAAQQRSQADEKPTAASDAQSVQLDVQRLQEAENPALHTGSDLPAPELLHEAMGRTPVPLKQFQDWAEAGNPTLKQAAAARESSEQQARQAALPPNPTVGYSGDHIRGGQYHGGEEGAFVQQTVVLGGKLGLRRDVYRREADANRIGMDQQLLRVRADVQLAFYHTLAAQRVVALQQGLLQLAADQVTNSHQLANLGQADAPDVLQAEVEREEAKIDYADAQRDYLRSFAMLAAAANQPNLPVSPLEGDLEQVPDLNADAAVARVLAESPELRRAEAEVAAAEARLKQQKREPVPDLQVQAGEWYSGERLDGINKAAGWMSFAQAGVELPLWNRNQGATGAARADVARAQADVTRTQLSLKQQAEPLAQSYLSARFQAERYKTELLPRAERAYELYSMKYQQMAAAYPQVLLSQRTLFRLQIGYLRALETEWTDAVRLQNYTLSGGLQGVGSGVDRDAAPGLTTTDSRASAAGMQGLRPRSGGGE